MAAISFERRETIERRLAKPMFVLAFVFLLFLAGVIHRVRDFGTADWDTTEIWVLAGGLLLIWPIFAVEAVLRWSLAPPQRRGRKAVLACLLTCLLPPLRMGARSVMDPSRMWLPRLGWQQVDFDLQKTLERALGVPLLLMALMIVPILTVEYVWAAAIEASPVLRLILAIAISIIWIAFATEFIVRISAADTKWGYAFSHWVDLAVVLLPMFEFMPFLRVVRLTRLMRLETVMAWVKYYRLYGLAGKGWRGFVLLQLIHRLLHRTPEAELTRLMMQMESKEGERRELDREIDYYRRKIAALTQQITDDARTTSQVEEHAPQREAGSDHS